MYIAGASNDLRDTGTFVAGAIDEATGTGTWMWLMRSRFSTGNGTSPSCAPSERTMHLGGMRTGNAPGNRRADTPKTGSACDSSADTLAVLVTFSFCSISQVTAVFRDRRSKEVRTFIGTSPARWTESMKTRSGQA